MKKANYKFKFLYLILAIGIIVFIINKFFIQICLVKGQSMEPTLNDGDIVLIEKITKELKFNDIIVIKKDKKIIIKRLVGLPYDKIKINKNLYINERKIENYEIKDKGDITDEILLGRDEYFVLGDNLEHSIDSRKNEIGIINKKEIIGKLVFNRSKK